MLQICNLNIVHKQDLRTIVKDFNLVLNDGDCAVIIGEEGNGKSTLLKWLYRPDLIDSYAEYSGKRISGNLRLAYLPQELPEPEQSLSVYEFFSGEETFFDLSPKELTHLAGQFGLPADWFYEDRTMGSLSGGEKIKAQLMRLIMAKPDVLLLDEPSNDLDLETLVWLENFIGSWEKIVLYISHDETLIENTANMVIHLEQLRRKTTCRHTIAAMPYRQYVDERLHLFEKQSQQAASDQREKKKRDEKFRRIQQSVEHAQNTISRADPSGGRLLKKKMHAVQSMGRRFEKMDENMTREPESEDEIFFTIGDENSAIPKGKTVLDFQLDNLKTQNGERILAEHIHLVVRGPEKVGIIGRNGAGKTTLLRLIAHELLGRQDIRTEYMPQNYQDGLNLDRNPVEFLNTTGEKNERTAIRTILGSLKYTADEMEHAMRDLSGGQKAKIFLLKMSMANPNVLILDEPTRNFSPLSGPVIRSRLAAFPGAVISISHDRKYLQEVCTKIYRLTENGLILEYAD